ncbi:hypothetical protein NA56DRAFT_656451 [Hyaloscypha hepaticicola]|uniref:Uncharacterized protein n=1 Tax=Hyaloscypha hepaticicola TaxID=2082293 RepID=A0A2J6QCI3_9HELO|nr:hypothetical protein NA56DRAFT_656451 [Hyaloscypha hepaticicola]
MSFTNNNQFCHVHLEPFCMTCSIMAPFPNFGETDATTELATSIYPGTGVDILAGPEPPSTSNLLAEPLRAPIAKMYRPRRPPALNIDTSKTYSSQLWHPVFEAAPEHDDYSERLALSPIEETSPGYAEELALTPVRCQHRQPKRGRPQRARKLNKSNRTDTLDCITVAVPEEQEQRAPESPRVRFETEDEKAGNSPRDKPVRSRKRKTRGEEAEEPVRKSRRSRKIVNYAEE